MKKLEYIMAKKKIKGQYFTPKEVTDFMVELIESKKPSIFEPCAGEGIFLQSLKEKKFDDITAFEIDNTLKNNSDVKISYKDTLFERPDRKFQVIIGNPPYVRWKNIDSDTQKKLKEDDYWKTKINGLNDLLYPFILLSIDLLENGGELIFITPTFWTSTLHAKIIRDKLANEGEITHMINFGEMKVFDKVSSNILIFRFVKTKQNNKIKVINVKSKKGITQKVINDICNMLNGLKQGIGVDNDDYESYLHQQFIDGEPWKPLPPKIEPLIKQIESSANSTLGDFVDIGNGMVSGLDKAFQINDTQNFTEREKNFLIEVVKAKNLKKYFSDGFYYYAYLNDGIFSEEDLNTLPNIKKHLLKYKDKLTQRYSYNKDIPWWHWVFLRNKKLIENQYKIVVPCKERFDKRQYVRFSLVEGDYYITQDVTVLVKKNNVKEDLRYFLAILNSDLIFSWLKYRGLRRGGVLEFSEKPLSVIPIRSINWNNQEEVKLYNEIIERTDLIRNDNKQEQIVNSLVKKLYKVI
jgi:adenine-specific DNA-methyltransferase